MHCRDRIGRDGKVRFGEEDRRVSGAIGWALPPFIILSNPSHASMHLIHQSMIICMMHLMHPSDSVSPTHLHDGTMSSYAS